MLQNSKRTSLISILILIEWVVVFCAAGGLLLSLLFQAYRSSKPTSPGEIHEETSDIHPGTGEARATATHSAIPTPTEDFTVEVLPPSPHPSPLREATSRSGRALRRRSGICRRWSCGPGIPSAPARHSLNRRYRPACSKESHRGRRWPLEIS